MRFFNYTAIAIVALEATLANAACRNTDIFLMDAVTRETKELWAWNIQTRPDNDDKRYKEVLRGAYDEKDYPFFFNNLLAQLCDSFAACTGNVSEDVVLGCLKNGLGATMLRAEDTTSLMAGRVKNYINQLVSSEAAKNDELDNQRGGKRNDQSGSSDNQRDSQEPS